MMHPVDWAKLEHDPRKSAQVLNSNFNELTKEIDELKKRIKSLEDADDPGEQD